MGMEKSEKWSIAVCGLNCAKCDIYMAYNGNEKLRDEIVEWFKKQRKETIKPEQIKCEGCMGPLDVHWSPECKMVLCAKRRELQHCFQCRDFPCTHVNEFSSDGIAHHRGTIENSKMMKKIGIEAWVAEQKRKGQCVFCP